MKNINTVIVGAGQAGLAVSYHLARQGRPHIVLDQAGTPASAWRNRSWHSLTLVTPNLAFRMPGKEVNKGDRDGFLTLSQVIKFFEDYAAEFNLPVQYKTTVLSVTAAGQDSYKVATSNGDFIARNVIIATGFHQRPRLPSFAASVLPAVRQLHSSGYRNPEQLPRGGVYVVGSGQSGAQIADELIEAGRKVYLSVGTAGRVPRRYRGKDIIEWLEIIGFLDLTPDQLPPGMGRFEGVPHLSGRDGGRTLNLHEFVRRGATLTGHVTGAQGQHLSIAPDLHASLEAIDRFEAEVTGAIDEHIRTNKLDVPPEKLPAFDYGYTEPVIESLDLVKEGIGTIIWATGYTFDYTLVKMPVLDGDGFPVQSRGVTSFPGLFFVGLPWMPSERSGFLLGVGDAARHIAETITSRETLSEKAAEHQR